MCTLIRYNLEIFTINIGNGWYINCSWDAYLKKCLPWQGTYCSNWPHYDPWWQQIYQRIALISREVERSRGTRCFQIEFANHNYLHSITYTYSPSHYADGGVYIVPPSFTWAINLVLTSKSHPNRGPKH